ncbi:N-acetyl-D-Glu racemase DgcA [Acuticoccus mangrovi]|uniref:Dipeptide epimerase n=1 Tax=Acuticoccus mangrovi TaxID=2796142 RepID=A0A934MEN5_9HYPH|nr:N-acetyl-D-Glu racemase DgcA [Acuticoccus mangrovi]MBJ3774085.1 dipeptide epimerase [Acuticoccus mangrovi]
MIRLTVTAEVFPIAGAFRISRESRTEAKVIVATITDGTHTGRGEAVPYPRYGETMEGVIAEVEAEANAIAEGLDREGLRATMKAGAARNAIDCALWDFEAKRSGESVAAKLGLTLSPLTTAYTLSLGEPEEMAEAARNAARPLLKVKLGGGRADEARIAAVREAAPEATLIVDANEGWSENNLLINMSACAKAGVALIEQPLPASRDGVLANISHPVPICADESVHTSGDLERLTARYDAVNVKLDKAGGLTEALAMVKAAKALDLKVMLGCMVGTSLSMAPAIYAAQEADFVDVDGPLLLAEDRTPGLHYEGSIVHPPIPELWG